jgi:hypothetical protein
MKRQLLHDPFVLEAHGSRTEHQQIMSTPFSAKFGMPGKVLWKRKRPPREVAVMCLVARGGIEPSTRGFSNLISN